MLYIIKCQFILSELILFECLQQERLKFYRNTYVTLYQMRYVKYTYKYTGCQEIFRSPEA